LLKSPQVRFQRQQVVVVRKSAVADGRRLFWRDAHLCKSSSIAEFSLLSHLFLSFAASFCYGPAVNSNDTRVSEKMERDMRADKRAADELRPVSIEDGAQPNAAGSVLIRMGGTHVLCGVSVEDKVPPFLLGSGQGWITAEYGMLPCATHTRGRREAVSGVSGRTYEIQRLIGRSLRMMVDLRQLGEHTLRVDCDVLNADGGTRCASITGAALALRQALARMVGDGRLAAMPQILPVAAVSVGVVGGVPLLDLAYDEDSAAEVDANFVMAADGRWIEMQCTAEGSPFQPELFARMQDLAVRGISRLLRFWQE
jgi:ribonuclease PH